jgi:hypothetical protein
MKLPTTEQLNAKYGLANKSGKGYLVWIDLPYAPALINAMIMHHHERRAIDANPAWFTKPASVGFGGL